MSWWQSLFGRSGAPQPAGAAPQRASGAGSPAPVPVVAVGDAAAPPRPRDADARFRACIDIVLAWEGGHVNDPRDHGGETNFGIADRADGKADGMADLDRDGRGDVRIADLSRAEAVEVYRAQYWHAVRGDDLPAGVDLAVFDLAVNSGVRRAILTLQRAAGVATDGKIGPVSMLAVRAAQPAALAERVCAQRLAFLMGLSQWNIYGRGWGRRVADIRAKAARMAGA